LPKTKAQFINEIIISFDFYPFAIFLKFVPKFLKNSLPSLRQNLMRQTKWIYYFEKQKWQTLMGRKDQ